MSTISKVSHCRVADYNYFCDVIDCGMESISVIYFNFQTFNVLVSKSLFIGIRASIVFFHFDFATKYYFGICC